MMGWGYSWGRGRAGWGGVGGKGQELKNVSKYIVCESSLIPCDFETLDIRK